MTRKEAFTKYHPVIRDLSYNYSTQQIATRNYMIDGKKQKVSESMIQELRDIHRNTKKKDVIDLLSGVDQQTTEDPMYYSAHSMTTPAKIHSTYADVPKSEMDARIQNAELKAELRFVSKELEALKSQLQQYEQGSLSGIEQKTSFEFLKRDFAELKEKYTDKKKSLDRMLPELEDLREKRKDWNRILEALEKANNSKELILGALSMIRPEMAQQISQGLGQLEAHTPTAEEEKALQMGQSILQAFQGEDFKILQDMINISYIHRDIMRKMLVVAQEYLRKKEARAQTVGMEANGAPTV